MDFNFRLLGKELTPRRFGTKTLLERKEVEVLNLRNPTDPTTRYLQRMQLAEFCQAYIPKCWDENSDPIITKNLTKTQALRLTFDTINAFSAKVRIYSSFYGAWSYVELQWNGDGTYRLFGNGFNKGEYLYIRFDRNTLYIYLDITGNTNSGYQVKVDELELHNSSLISNGTVNISDVLGTRFVCTRYNSRFTPNAFEQTSDPASGYKDLNDKYPTLLLIDPIAKKFYIPDRAKIYSAINAERICLFGIDVLQSADVDSSGMNITQFDNTLISVSKWSGDLTLRVYGKNDNFNVINIDPTHTSGLYQGPRKLTIINQSTATIYFTHTSNPLPNTRTITVIQPNCTCTAFYTNPTSQYTNVFVTSDQISYVPVSGQYEYNGNGGTYYITTFMPKLSYVRDRSTGEFSPPGRLYFGTLQRIGTGMSIEQTGLFVLNSSDQVVAFCPFFGKYDAQGTITYPSIPEITACQDRFLNQPPLSMGTINWNANDSTGVSFIVGSQLLPYSVLNKTLLCTVS